MTIMDNKKLPIGIQSFEGLIKGNYLYVDKTKYIYEIIHLATKNKEALGGRYFLSRPRRFGKSLLISTMDAIFQNKKSLFKDLWLEKSDYQWSKYPVIWIDLSEIDSSTIENLKTGLIKRVKEEASKYEILLNEDQPPHEVFNDLIKLLKEKMNNKVVVLIDEYDKPIIDQITNPEVASHNRALLRSFYGILKSQDASLRFVFLTGVSKFSKVSVFSGLNNLNDISMDSKYANLLGYTQDELIHYFNNRILELAANLNKEKSQILKEIEYWYNGYQFSESNLKVYNPFSTLLLFDKQQFKNYWFESGTPTFLVNLVKNQEQMNLHDFEGIKVPENAFSSYEIENLAIIPLMLQTGYLTIKEYIQEEGLYTLGYPNEEVRKSFLDQLLSGYSNVEAALAGNYIYKLQQAISDENLEEFFEILKLFFANIPYDIQISQEKYYQTIFYLIHILLGYRMQAEVRTNIGRIDSVIETKKSIYLFEFKLNGTKEEALAQIKEKKYYEKYLDKKKTIIMVGTSFNTNTRNISDWLAEEYKK